MQGVVVGWSLYARTGRALTLGYVGLAQALPILLFALPAGHVADRYARKQVVVIAQLAFCVCSVGLAVLSARHAPIGFFYACLFCAAAARAFGNPARSALLPQIVAPGLLANAISWDTSIRRIAVMSGAALGGWLLALTHTAAHVYLIAAALGMGSASLIGLLPDAPTPTQRREAATWQTVLAGVTYIRQTNIILATITLDLFAVLLGGATTLLPVYARDILRVGPNGLGWLRAAPSMGALVMALTLAHLRPFRLPGRSMLWAVAGYGVATIVFGFSRLMWLSLAALFGVGAFDMVSVVVRQTLVQTLTPNAMRGRVNAVNSVFMNSSNEIGGFESGVVAQLTSSVFSVVSGGLGTLAVVGLAAFRWPAIHRYRPDTRSPDSKPEN